MTQHEPASSLRSRLAIDGGVPLRATPLPARMALGPDEERMIADVIGYYRQRGLDPGYQGHFEKLYTDAFAASLGGGYADAVGSGTLALYLAVAALKLPPASEVLISPITDPGTLSAITLNGLKPRLMDAQPGSYNVGVAEFSTRITDKVSAAMIVHALGQATPIDEIVSEARRHGIRVIEDCSQSHGALCAGSPVGTFGDIAAFSTMYRKAHAAGGSSGVVFTRDLGLHQQALALSDRGKPQWRTDFDDRDPRGFLFPALNMNSDEISCGIGYASLARLPETIRRRQEFVASFGRRLSQFSTACRAYPHSLADSPFALPIVVDPARITCSVISFAEAVRAEGIGLNPCYRYVVAEWPWAHPLLADDFNTPRATEIRDRTFILYLNENYGAQEAMDAADAIAKVERFFQK